MRISFSDFLNKKNRENKKHLHILNKIFEKAGFRVINNLNDSKEPYIFVRKPDNIDTILEGLSFGGVRIYTRGKDTICFRSQNKKDTEPFGSAYVLDIAGMYKDLIDESNKNKIGHQIIFYLIKELRNFFIKSAEAEKTLANIDSQLGNIAVANTTGTDYANMVTNIDKR